MMLYPISAAPPEIRRWGESGNWIAYDPDSGAHLIRPKGIKTHRGRPWYILVVPHRPEWATPPHPMFAFEKHNLGADSLDDALRQAEEWLPKLIARRTAEYGYWADGVYVPIEARRLREEEFNEHLSGLNKAQESFDAALNADDDDGMRNALYEAFPHELALLI